MDKILRTQLIEQLNQVSPSTMWGAAIKLFMKDIKGKTNDELLSLVTQLQSQSFDNPPLMKKILGSKPYQFIVHQLSNPFKQMEVPA